MSDEPLDCGRRLGRLTRPQLQAALDRFGLGRLEAVAIAESGIFGQNLFLATDSGHWVFRGAPHVLPGERAPGAQLAKEQWFAERLHSATRAPVPWPYYVERSTDLFGWPFALMPRLPGAPVQVVRRDLPPAERVEIAREMGATLAELHALRAPAPGEWDAAVEAIRPDTSLRQYALRVADGCRERADLPPTTLDAEDLALVERVVRESEPALDVTVEPACLHLDYHWGNVNVARADGTWRVTGVFDLMTCEFGDPEMDLSRPCAVFATDDPPLVAPFLEAYTALRPLRPGAQARFRLFMLIDRLIIWSFGKRTQDWFGPDARFRDFARGYLDLDALI
jgi:hygromycin-B 7''-O-kinase